jgi:hypothetical protein
MNNVISDDHRRSLFLAVAGFIFVIGLLSMEAASAQQWVLQPELRAGYEYDDNARLRSEDDEIQEIDGFILEGSLGIGYNTQRTNFELTPRLRSRIYDETPDVDSNDQFLDFDFEHETLKGRFEVRSSYEREAVRTGERADPDFDIDDPDEIPTDETGFVLNNERRERFRIMPKWNYDLTERLIVGLGADYIDVSYDEALTSFLVDYTDARLQGLLGWRFSERTRGYFGARVRRYENDLDNEVDGIGGAIGIESEISETTSFQAEVGYEDTERVSTGQSDGNFVADLNLVRTLETITMLAQYRRNVAASGAGRVSARDSLNFTVRKRFTERVYGALGVRAYQTEGLEQQQTVTFEERDFTEFRANLGVAISRAFSVEGDYRHARIDRGGLEGSANSNSIILWLVYRPTEIIN